MCNLWALSQRNGSSHTEVRCALIALDRMTTQETATLSAYRGNLCTLLSYARFRSGESDFCVSNLL